MNKIGPYIADTIAGAGVKETRNDLDTIEFPCVHTTNLVFSLLKPCCYARSHFLLN